MPKRNPETGKNIAIIGVGPSGLTCAFFLARMGCPKAFLEYDGCSFVDILSERFVYFSYRYISLNPHQKVFF